MVDQNIRNEVSSDFTHVYAVRDIQLDSMTRLFLCSTDVYAKRYFENMCRADPGIIGFSEHFDLYFVGTFQHSGSGVMYLDRYEGMVSDDPQLLLRGVKFVEVSNGKS